MAYNNALSAKRANNVSNFLTDMGVSNFVVDEDALGETELAVQTGDEVKSQANRRVVIQFLR
jgi:outer membrane protein OmpA-like peptidoglycan-associated protein